LNVQVVQHFLIKSLYSEQCWEPRILEPVIF